MKTIEEYLPQFPMPRPIMVGLIRYAEHGIPTGSFLRSVLCNDLNDAVCRADDGSLPALRAICQFVHNELPSACHGSQETVDAWIDAKHKERELVSNERQQSH